MFLSNWNVLQTLIYSLPKIRYDAKWIALHQDKYTPYCKLEFPAQLNCDADHLAAEKHDQP